MFIKGRETLQDENVCLILTEKQASDPDKNWAPCYKYKICQPEKRPFFGYIPVGGCDLRFGYNENLYYGGHIGYHVDEHYQGNHMAQKAARLLLEEAWKHNMPYIIITCNPDNAPSRRTIEGLMKEYQKNGRYAELLEVVDLPSYNDMYKDGERQKCVYCFSQSEEKMREEDPMKLKYEMLGY